ncbi:hypothetical protein BDB00DRAFT_557994 [Zychaea mexicana]|uniref:uncharacterized protein n=1 Tax=Zychaea mexicana TaxID=64656 RepID=UPI0022FF3995|nr:uncharacterized protein BDB00DRAFT_557994 [Zychaea mexicana]KAI9490330.1 hypothetical protein BDB00DRAFT_557994 [Zychaea mexicana]
MLLDKSTEFYESFVPQGRLPSLVPRKPQFPTEPTPPQFLQIKETSKRSVNGGNIRTSTFMNPPFQREVALPCFPQASVPGRTYSSTVPTNKRNIKKVCQRREYTYLDFYESSVPKGGCPPLFSASLSSRRNLLLPFLSTSLIPGRTYTSPFLVHKPQFPTEPTPPQFLQIKEIAQRSVSGEHIRTSLHTLSLSVFEEDKKPR